MALGKVTVGWLYISLAQFWRYAYFALENKEKRKTAKDVTYLTEILRIIDFLKWFIFSTRQFMDYFQSLGAKSMMCKTVS